MRILRYILAALGVVVVALGAAFYLYLQHHAMAAAQPIEVGRRGEHPAVLIATQGSKYKDDVVRGLLEQLRGRARYVRVVDVSVLPTISETEWNAIVLMHTWESWKPEPNAAAFIERAQARGKLVVLTTSGAGDERMPGVDAVTSASQLERAPADAAELGRRVDALLGARAIAP